jgi:hypothetical protein
VLSKYEAMAVQVDESTREIDDAQLDARRAATKAASSLRRAEEEESQIADLRRQLDEERRARATLAQEFARYREAVANAPVKDPWGQLWRAISQITGDAVAWTRSKIPPDSQLLPWFDKAVDFAAATGRLVWSWSVALYEWGRPRAIELWKWVKSEIERRMSGTKR